MRRRSTTISSGYGIVHNSRQAGRRAPARAIERHVASPARGDALLVECFPCGVKAESRRPSFAVFRSDSPGTTCRRWTACAARCAAACVAANAAHAASQCAGCAYGATDAECHRCSSVVVCCAPNTANPSESDPTVDAGPGSELPSANDSVRSEP